MVNSHHAAAGRGGAGNRSVLAVLSFPYAGLLFLWLCCAVLAQAGTQAPPLPDRWAAMQEPFFKSYSQRAIAGTIGFAQDKSGFIWMGTQAGLVRWDGYEFKRYLADAAAPGTLPDSYILCLHVDPLGRLWIGTSAGGLARYAARLENFVTYHAAQAGLVKGRVGALADDGSGGLWIGTGSGLDHLDAGGTIRNVPIPAPLPGAAGRGGVNALQHDDDGTLWIGTRQGVWRRAPGASAFVAVPLPVAGGAPVAVNRLYRDSGRRTWIATETHGAFVVAPGAVAAAPVVERGPAPMLAQQRVTGIVEAEPGRIWLGTEGGGVLIVDAHTGATRRVRHRADSPGSLPEDDAVALFRERSGLVLVAGVRMLSQYDPRQRAVLSLLMDHGGTSMAAVAAMPDGRVWLGVDSGGIKVLDPATGALTALRSDGEGLAAAALGRSRVLALLRGPDGNVYIGTRQGLFRSDAEGRHVERLAIPQRDISAQVWVMAFDGPTLWMGGLDGLWALDVSASGQNAVPRVLRHETTGLGDIRVTAIVRGTGSALWVGTMTGLVRFDVESGKTAVMSTAMEDAGHFPAGYVSSLLIDRRGRLWATVYGGGVALLESGDVAGQDRFRRLGLREGMPDTGANKLLEDGAGRLWASTDDGLALIDGTTLAVRALQGPQGVHVLPYWTNSGDIGSHGELLFGGQTGLTVVRPALYEEARYSAPMVVSDIRLDGKALPGGPYNEIGHAAGAPLPALSIPAGRGGFSVEFSALDYAAPERNRYEYRLRGYDAGWIAADVGYRRASYDKLSPGDYTLMLRGSNHDGVWSATRELALRVTPMWYQTIWWRILVVLCAVGLVFGLVQGRTAYLRRNRRKLQALVAERTAELRATQHQLEQLAYADPLTGLPNRRLFNDDLQSRVALALRDGKPFGLLLIDLDHFKEINDTIGHDAGDALLVEVALRLGAAVRDADRVARLGGDEFAVLLSNASGHDDILLVCQRIVTSLALPVAFDGHMLQVSASIGVAVCPAHGSSSNALYKAADVALYAAKRGGRNTWRWYEGDGEASA